MAKETGVVTSDARLEAQETRKNRRARVAKKCNFDAQTSSTADPNGGEKMEFRWDAAPKSRRGCLSLFWFVGQKHTGKGKVRGSPKWILYGKDPCFLALQGSTT